jgi:hypothetical protein
VPFDARLVDEAPVRAAHDAANDSPTSSGQPLRQLRPGQPHDEFPTGASANQATIFFGTIKPPLSRCPKDTEPVDLLDRNALTKKLEVVFAAVSCYGNASH